MGSTHGRSTVAKGNRSFFCLLWNRQGHQSHTILLCNNNSAEYNNCSNINFIFKQLSTLVLPRLNFEHQHVCRSATGVFFSPRLGKKNHTKEISSCLPTGEAKSFLRLHWNVFLFAAMFHLWLDLLWGAVRRKVGTQGPDGNWRPCLWYSELDCTSSENLIKEKRPVHQL